MNCTAPGPGPPASLASLASLASVASEPPLSAPPLAPLVPPLAPLVPPLAPLVPPLVPPLAPLAPPLVPLLAPLVPLLAPLVPLLPVPLSLVVPLHAPMASVAIAITEPRRATTGARIFVDYHRHRAMPPAPLVHGARRAATGTYVSLPHIAV
jgi:hypothetical protein